MEIFARFPGGREKALTLSYDDGVEQDAQLIAIMKKYGLKGTFNVNSGLYAPEGTVYPAGQIHRIMPLSRQRQLYTENGMEVAMHSLTHPYLTHLPEHMCTYEILQDRINLEREYDTIIRGFAYPYGACSDDVVEVLRRCRVLYARTTKNSGSFKLPEDWLRLPPTAHHRDPKLMELAEKFLVPNKRGKPELFYLWGHSYEFERDDNWDVIENFAAFLGNRQEIWYATNAEIFEYLTAYRQLVFSTASAKVFNPTCRALYFCADGVTRCVGPGETVSFG